MVVTNCAILGDTANTIDQYNYLSNYLLERLGFIPVQEFGSHHIRTFIAGMHSEHKSVDLQDKCLKRLRQVLETAIIENLVTQNAVDVYKREPRHGMPQRKVAPRLLVPYQATTLIKAARNEPLGALFILALATGLRFGELLALQRKEVDLNRGRLRVNATLQDVPKQPLDRKAPKTPTSVREIPLLPFAIAVLREHEARQKKRLAKRNIISPWIFANARGGPLRQSNVRHRAFKPLLKRCGLPDVNFHSLRKSFISMLAREGVHVKEAQALAGHKDSRMTLDVYTHIEPSLLGERVARLDKYFKSNRSQTVVGSSKA